MFGAIKKTKNLAKTIEVLDLMNKYMPLMLENFHDYLLNLMMDTAANTIVDLALVHQRLDLFNKYGNDACDLSLKLNISKKASSQTVPKPATHLIILNQAINRIVLWRTNPQYKEQDNAIFNHVLDFIRVKFNESIADSANPDIRCLDILREFIYALTLLDRMDPKQKHNYYVFVEFLLAYLLVDKISLITKTANKSNYKIWTALLLKERSAYMEILMVACGLKKAIQPEEGFNIIKLEFVKLSGDEKNHVFNTIVQKLMPHPTLARLNLLHELFVNFQQEIDCHHLINHYSNLLPILSSFLRKPREASEWSSTYLLALHFIEFAKILVFSIQENKKDYENCKLLCIYILEILLDKSIASQIPCDLNQDISSSTIIIPSQNISLSKTLSWRKSLIHAFKMTAPFIRHDHNKYPDSLNRMLDILFLKIETLELHKALELVKNNWDIAMDIFVDTVYHRGAPDMNHRVSDSILKKFIEKMGVLNLEGITETQFIGFENARMAIFGQMYQLMGLKPDRDALMDTVNLYMLLALKSLEIRVKHFKKLEWPICPGLKNSQDSLLPTLKEVDLLLSDPIFIEGMDITQRELRDALLANWNKKTRDHKGWLSVSLQGYKG